MSSYVLPGDNSSSYILNVLLSFDLPSQRRLHFEIGDFEILRLGEQNRNSPKAFTPTKY